MDLVQMGCEDRVFIQAAQFRHHCLDLVLAISKLGVLLPQC